MPFTGAAHYDVGRVRAPWPQLRALAAPLVAGLRRRWPAIRALVVVYHVALIVVLSLPSAAALRTRAIWDNANTQADLAGWAAALGRVGVELSGPELGARLHALAGEVADAQAALVRPFLGFSHLVGLRQGWAMFASPQRYPFEIHVDLEVDGVWRPLYRPHDDAAAWRRATFEHNRFRKLAGSFARRFNRRRYDELAAWLGRQALADHPSASRARVLLHAYRTLAPAEVRAGERPRGRDREVRIFTAEAGR